MFSIPFIVGYCIDPSSEFLTALKYDLTKSFLSALITTVLIGTMTKYISDDLISVQKNNKKLKEYGITEIGTGKMSYHDEIEMFGSRISKKYPRSLDFMFLTGNSFLSQYKTKIKNAVANGCQVRLLIVRPVINGQPNGYLARYSRITDTDKYALAREVYTETLPIMNEIEEYARKTNTGKCGTIEIRTYIDEFRLNQRFSTYVNKGKYEIKCWLNVQSTIKTAIKLSLLLRGAVSPDDLNNHSTEEKSLMLASYLSFEKLWELYPDSCPKEEEYAIFQELDV